jgi:hypothetical protein
MRRLHVFPVLLFALLWGACFPKTTSISLSQPEPVLVALVYDQENEASVAPFPSSLASELEARLTQRGLLPRFAESQLQADAFERRRATGQRLDWLRGQAQNGERVLLVETRSSYVSQMAGRWRWVVSAQLSIVRGGTLEVLDARVEIPVFLQFGNESGEDALTLSGPTLMQRLERLLDTALSTANEDSVGTRDLPGSSPVENKNGLIYFAMVDRFSNGTPENDGTVDTSDPTAFHGGDLRGLINRLDYLQALGVKTLWLSPVFEMRTEHLGEYGAFHGYWLEDPYRVEPRFGTEADLLELAQGLKERDMALYLDMVNNHVAYDSPRLESHPEWFHGLGDIVDWGEQVQVEAHDVHGLPDLDQSQSEVRDWLVGAGRYWIDAVSPAGFRLDAVRHVPASFWADYNTEMQQAGGSSFVLAGELFDGDPSAVASVWREGRFTAMFDFPLYYALVDVFCGEAAPGRLASVLWADRFYDTPDDLITFIDNHDLPRAVSACGGDLTAVAEMVRFLFAVRGTPALTWGTEAALTGPHEPENRADMPWGAETPLRSVILESDLWRPVTAGGRVVALDDEGFSYLRSDGRLLRLRDGKVGLVEPEKGCCGEDARPGTMSARAEGSPKNAGDRLFLVGGGPELGAWNPAKGIELPVEEAQFPAGAVLEFKLVLLKPSGEAVWEDRPNRYALVSSGERIDLELDWGV